MRNKHTERMKHEMPVKSMIGGYLALMRSENPEGAAGLEADLTEVFTTGAGIRVLYLLEKSVLLAGVPNGSPESALREANAVRNFVLEIRRFVANG